MLHLGFPLRSSPRSLPHCCCQPPFHLSPPNLCLALQNAARGPRPMALLPALPPLTPAVPSAQPPPGAEPLAGASVSRPPIGPEGGSGSAASSSGIPASSQTAHAPPAVSAPRAPNPAQPPPPLSEAAPIASLQTTRLAQQTPSAVRAVRDPGLAQAPADGPGHAAAGHQASLGLRGGRREAAGGGPTNARVERSVSPDSALLCVTIADEACPAQVLA